MFHCLAHGGITHTKIFTHLGECIAKGGHGFVATRILKHRGSTIWQRRFWEQQICDENDFARLV
ncbi:MAG: hypothetical protein ABL869_14815, partial [Candidatus Nitrotoga sp.]